MRDLALGALEHRAARLLFVAPHDGMAPLAEPLPGELGRDLEMALEAIGGAAEAEGLVAAGGAGHQMHRALRHVERVFVPLQDALTRRQAGQQRIRLTLFRDLDLRIADLELLAAPYRLAEGARQQLAAEAEAEQR